MAKAATAAKRSITADVPFAIPDWPASRVEAWPLDMIKPYPQNPRTHPTEQITLLAHAMKDEGVTMPILVDEAGVIIAGHGRLLAAQQNGFREYPVVVARGWPENKKRAARIRDNQIGALSGWDDKLLRIEVGDLQLQGYEMPMLGFPDGELAQLFLEPAAEEEEKALTPEQQTALDLAWRRMVKEWRAHSERSKDLGFVSTNFTRGALMAHFMRAWLFGDDIPRAATTAYCPHRIFIEGAKSGAWVDFLDLAASNDEDLGRMRWSLQGRPSFDKMIGMSLALHDRRLPSDFPPLLARDLINEFTPEDGKILDPCHGWGGRVLGFMLSHAGSYQGFDTDEKTVKGVTEMFRDLDELRPGRKAVMTCSPYEDAKLAPASFDFALTSPPYFNVERYGGEKSSWKRYGSFEAWVGGFYKPLIEKTAAALKAGGAFALQIGNQSYPLEENARAIVGGCGLEFVEKRTTDMVNNYNQTDPQDGEIVLILRKKGGDGKAKTLAKYGEPL